MFLYQQAISGKMKFHAEISKITRTHVQTFQKQKKSNLDVILLLKMLVCLNKHNEQPQNGSSANKINLGAI